MKLLHCQLPHQYTPLPRPKIAVSMGIWTRARTLARTGMFPQVFACTLAADEVSAVKSTMALMLTHSLPASSFNPPPSRARENILPC